MTRQSLANKGAVSPFAESDSLESVGCLFDVRESTTPSETDEPTIRERLQRSEKMLEMAMESTDLWAWTFDWTKNTAHFPERVCKTFGTSELVEDFPSSWFARGILEACDIDPITEFINTIKQGAERSSVDIQLHVADGSVHWARIQLMNLTDDNNVPTGIAVGSTMYIDDLKNLERRYQIERNRSRLEDNDLVAYASFNLTQEIALDADGGEQFPQLSEISNIEQLGEIVAANIVGNTKRLKCLDIHRRHRLLELYNQGKRELSLEYRFRMINGDVNWIRADFHLLRDPESSDVLVFAYCHNINHQKTMDLMVDFAVGDDYDLLGCFSFRDNRATMMFGVGGYNEHESPSVTEDYTTSMNRFAENAVVSRDREAYIRQASIENIRHELQTKHSVEFTFHTYDVGALRQERTKSVRYVRWDKDPDICLWSQTDVTTLVAEESQKQEELQEALDAAELGNQAKTDFLSNMSHEIRTPMNAIIGMTRLASDVPNNPGETADYLDKIASSSQYLLGILNDVLDMSRIESGRLELHPRWISAQEYFYDCVDMIEPSMKEKGVTFVYPKATSHNQIEVYVDPLRVRQIAMNLLNNAFKFTPAGGTISVSFEEIARTDIQLTERVTFSDTGCGMSEEFMERIFSPFEQEQNPYSETAQGTGLGLALVKHIIESMGGTIRVTSELGVGSSFVVEFTCMYRKWARRHSTAEYERPRADLEGHKVLLVDDNLLNREIASSLLAKRGMIVEIATNGLEAVGSFEQSEEGTYDAVLMDIRMPEMNGLEATRAIRALERDDATTVPIIAMTANAFEEDAQKSLEAGMNAHLNKPIEPDILFQVLSEEIASHEAALQ